MSARADSGSSDRSFRVAANNIEAAEVAVQRLWMLLESYGLETPELQIRRARDGYVLEICCKDRAQRDRIYNEMLVPELSSQARILLPALTSHPH